MIWKLSGAKTASAALFAVLLCLFPFSSAGSIERGPVGLTALDQLDKLPYLWVGRQARHFSSRDPDGGNDDRGFYLNTAPVLFEAKGAGCVYRIWTTNQVSATNFAPYAHGRIKIWVDDPVTPKVDMPMSDFFSGQVGIFQFPLVGSAGESSGGFYCYMPIPFRQYCKILWVNETGAQGMYYNIDWVSYNSSDGVESFTGTENISSVLSKWQNAGVDPKSTPVGEPTTGKITVPRGSSRTLCTLSGPACISRILLKPDARTTMTDSEWQKVNVRLKFDNHSDADVYTSFGRFFGGDLHRPSTSDSRQSYEKLYYYDSANSTWRADIKGLLFGTNTLTGWNYNYFPMPFAGTAVLELENTQSSSDFTVEYKVYTSPMPDAARLLGSGQVGYFRSTQKVTPTYHQKGSDYVLMDQPGRGVVVGYVYTPFAGTNPPKTESKYLEGDERIHIDGSGNPQIYGTGTEDTFNCGWYFKQGRMSLPTHGYTTQSTSQLLSTSNKGRAIYRLLIGDQIPFSSRIMFGFECGKKNGEDPNDEYEDDDIAGASMLNTVFYYAAATSGSLVETDSVDVGVQSSETDHAYSRTGSLVSGSSVSSYEGDDDWRRITNTGYWYQSSPQVTATCRFTLGIRPDNYGVKLRKLSYYALRNQEAIVKVDGDTVGTWYEAGGNVYHCWRDSDFEIPADFTQGKSSITIELLPVNVMWTEHRYSALCYVSPTAAPLSPVVTDQGQFTASMTSISFAWTRPDEPVWGISRYSYAIGTSPGASDVRDWTDAGSSLFATGQDLDLKAGSTYYVSVRAQNGAGVWSAPATSDGITVVTDGSVADAKNSADNRAYMIRGCTVTAAFNGHFYAQDSSGRSGLRINHGVSVAEGDVVDVQGVLVTLDGERQMNAEAVSVKR